MIRVNDIAYTGYPVTDIARARAFYEKVLGLTTAETFEHEGRHWIEYNIGSSTLAITNMNPEWKATGDGPAVALEVEDFEAAVAELRQNKVRFFGEPSGGPTCQLALIYDPDGNSIAIHRRK